MNIIHWVNPGLSGLISTTKVLGKYEEQLGHRIEYRAPSDNSTLQGERFEDHEIDIHCAHHQIHANYLKTDKPLFIFLHGEASYCIQSPGSFEAVCNLMSIGDAAISFQPYDTDIWQTFGRVHTIRKGVDLETFKLPPKDQKKREGEPSLLFIEHWHWTKNPLYTVAAVERLRKDFPKIALYLVGCPDADAKRWADVIHRNRYDFIRGLGGIVTHPEALIPEFDMVISPVFPSYGVVPMEAIACGVPVVGYKNNPDVTFPCEPYDIDSMCDAIRKAINEPADPKELRKYAEKTFSGKMMAKDMINIYQAYTNAFKRIRR